VLGITSATADRPIGKAVAEGFPKEKRFRSGIQFKPAILFEELDVYPEAAVSSGVSAPEKPVGSRSGRVW
jgi:hypothetical protein